MAKSQGSILVDFAGSLDEARAFAKEHGLNAPQNHALRGAQKASGCSVISGRFNTKAEKAALSAKLASLGWDEGSQRVGA